MLFFKTKLPLSILSLITLSLLALSAQAQSTSVIPYQGTLFSQGKPVSQDAPVKMAFAIYSDDAELEAGQFARAPESPARKWTSWDPTGQEGDTVDANKTIDIQVRNGRFFVHLGDTGQETLSDTVFDEETLYVVTWIVNDNDAVYRLPPQELRTVPHAVTAKRANSFEVSGDLKVNGKITGLGIVPIGTILPYHLNVENADNLSAIRAAGFALCDGTSPAQQGITDPVITATPNLNGQIHAEGRGYYLRGGQVSGRFNQSSSFTGNGTQYSFPWTPGSGYYGAPFGTWHNTELGQRDNFSFEYGLGGIYIQVAAMTVVYIIRVK